MRAGLIISLLLLLTSTLLAQHIHGVPTVDTIAGKKDLVPFSIKIPPHPMPHRDTVHPKEKAENVLAFPFVVRSLETNWGFGGIAARFFKPMKDTTVRTSHTPGAFELNGWHYAYGGGLRFMLSKEEKLNLRLDYGIARHSNAFTV
jgi:hypothetical protein